jgi:hypothetical protein
VTDARFNQLESMLQGVQVLIAELQEVPYSPVEESRLRQIDQYVGNSLATLRWFTNRYPDEETA